MAYYKSDPNIYVSEFLEKDDDVAIVRQKTTNPDIAVNDMKVVTMSHVKEYVDIDSDDECHHRNKQDGNKEFVPNCASLKTSPSSSHTYEKTKRKNDTDGSSPHVRKRRRTIPNHWNGDGVRKSCLTPEKKIKEVCHDLTIENSRTVLPDGHDDARHDIIADRVYVGTSTPNTGTDVTANRHKLASQHDYSLVASSSASSPLSPNAFLRSNDDAENDKDAINYSPIELPEDEISEGFSHLDSQYIISLFSETAETDATAHHDNLATSSPNTRSDATENHYKLASQHNDPLVVASSSSSPPPSPKAFLSSNDDAKDAINSVPMIECRILPEYEILEVFPHLDIEYIRTILNDCHNDTSTALSYIAENMFATNSAVNTNHDSNPSPPPLPSAATRNDRYDKPIHWSDTDQILVEVSPLDDEYWIVDERLKRDMNDANISKLFRIQNRSLWIYYNFHKERFTDQSIEHNEEYVWHGTKHIDPSMIYQDQMDGFMVQFARVGSYGRGIYFTEQSSYCHLYSFHGLRTTMPDAAVMSPPTDRPILNPDEQEIFLATLLVGTSVTLPKRDRKLVVPPIPQERGTKTHIRRYNTVIGWSSGSKLYVVYENGRAYPSYLVRYYIGERDHQRTPYASREVALLAKEEIQASRI